MKKRIPIVAVTMTVLSMLVAGPDPASAHDANKVFHGPEQSTKYDHAWTNADHDVLYVCDKEADNHRVEAWIWTPGKGPVGPFPDLDGSKGGCTPYDLGFDAHRLAVCERTKGCTEYHNT
jgi:hypothetical protein